MSVPDLERMFGYLRPGNDIVPVTPDDDNDLAIPGRAILVEVSGTLRITTTAGNVRNITAALVPNNTRLDVGVKKVHATGTTATGIWIYT